MSAETPADSPLTMEEALAAPLYRDLRTPRLGVGDEAFDFELRRYDFADGTRRGTGERVRLADFVGVRPVALVFGSYT
jgi:hypothetical protein